MVKYLIFLIFSMNLIGKDFEVKLYYQNKVIIREPCVVVVEIKNISEKEIIISSWWDRVKLEVRRADGKKRRQVIDDEQYKIVFPMSGVKVKPGGVLIKREDIFSHYEDEPGDFFVRYKYISIGDEVMLEEGEKKELVKSWAGEIISEEVRIELKEPEGEDREAYEYFKGYPLARPMELLEKFPTSTYAGWALFKMPNASWGLKNEEIDREKKKYKDMVEIFLQHHPEFAYSGTLALNAAYISLEFEDYKSACELFKKAIELPKKFPLTKKSEEIYKKLKDEGKCK